MKILLLGGGGYVGRVLVDRLAGADHALHVYDLFYFSRETELAALAKTTVGDTRELIEGDFAGIDVVLDLAAISNDPSGELHPDLTGQVNAAARIRAADLAKRMGVRRYVLFSSCSVYGANDGTADETTALNPLTEYAASNARAEQGVLALADGSFCATALRLATVFGISPSMRFDLVVNTMALSVFDSGRLKIIGGGNQFRPLVHVADVAEAAARLIRAPEEAVAGQIFNIGHANLQIREVAEAVVRSASRPVEMQIGEGDVDQRNYRVAMDKAEKVFGFVAERTVESGAAAIFDALERRAIAQRPYTVRLNGYREMIAKMVS